MRESDVAYIALGSNIGDRRKFLDDARSAIAAIAGVKIIGETGIEETAPIGPVKQAAFLNQMIAVETTLPPEALLRALQSIEDAAGRKRGARWGPRTLDLDVVALEGGAVVSENLIVPHPELPNRDFWLRELAQLRQSTGEPR